ncbi:hypothetical protein [Nostoc sp. CCY 9925]|uniref:hypothetical protein n=1 Tax=Nostoc sp. CCY 9925 TaxID=3103865 RepID=UPI0039C5B8CF
MTIHELFFLIAKSSPIPSGGDWRQVASGYVACFFKGVPKYLKSKIRTVKSKIYPKKAARLGFWRCDRLVQPSDR